MPEALVTRDEGGPSTWQWSARGFLPLWVLLAPQKAQMSRVLGAGALASHGAVLGALQLRTEAPTSSPVSKAPDSERSACCGHSCTS